MKTSQQIAALVLTKSAGAVEAEAISQAIANNADDILMALFRRQQRKMQERPEIQALQKGAASFIPNELAQNYFFANPYGLDFHTWARMQDANQGEDVPTEPMPELEEEEPPYDYDADPEAAYMPNAPDTPDVGTEPEVSPVAPVPLPGGRVRKTAALLQMVAFEELSRRGILKTSNGDALEKPVIRQKVEEFLRRNKLAGDLIPGGAAEGMSVSDFPKKQMALGQKVESEHTPNPQMQREIAKDHLAEGDGYRKRGRQEAAAKFGLDASELLGQDEQRKDDMHQQELRHNEENHQIEVAKGQLELQQAQETFGMKQEQQAQKNQEQQAQQQMAMQMQQQQQQAQSQQYMANMAGGGGGQQPPQQSMRGPR